MARGQGGFGIRSYSHAQDFGTSLTLAKPAGLQAGDLLVAVLYGVIGGGSPAWAGPSGFTEERDANGVAVYQKLAGASEAATFTFGYSSNSALGGYLIAIRTAAFDVVGNVAADSTASGITMSATGLLLGFYARSTAGITIAPPSGMTTVDQDSDGTDPSLGLFEQSVASGATGNRTTATTVQRSILIGITRA